MFFFGRYEHSLDNKFRTRIPARLRADLGEAPTIGINDDGSLVIYPVKTMENFGKKIDELGISGQKKQLMKLRISNMYSIDEDSQGRFTLNAKLREYAGITKDIVFVGGYDRIYLWDKKRWEEFEASCPKDIDLDEYGI